MSYPTVWQSGSGRTFGRQGSWFSPPSSANTFGGNAPPGNPNALAQISLSGPVRIHFYGDINHFARSQYRPRPTASRQSGPVQPPPRTSNGGAGINLPDRAQPFPRIPPSTTPSLQAVSAWEERGTSPRAFRSSPAHELVDQTTDNSGSDNLSSYWDGFKQEMVYY